MSSTILLSTIKNNPRNPRVIKDAAFEKLKKSISEFPKMMALRPIVIDENGYALGGNQRLKALKDLGFKEIPEEWVKKASDLSEEEKAQFMIKDNNASGEWDWEILKTEWDVTSIEDWGLEIPNDEIKEDVKEESAKDPFNDTGIEAKNSFGVIVLCDSEGAQESIYRDLLNMGYKCKVVVV